MTVTHMNWASTAKVDSAAEVTRMKRANEKILSQALAQRDVDSDAGTFAHKTIRPRNTKLKTRAGVEVTVETTWTAT